MLRIIYLMVGMTLLGFLLLAFFFGLAISEYFLIIGICFLVGVFFYAVVGGEEPSDPKSFSRGVEGLGKWTVWIAFSPILLPIWILWQLIKLVRWVIRIPLNVHAKYARRRASAAADATRRAIAIRSSEERRKRNDLLFSCELFYSAHAAQLADRFSKKQLDDFIARYCQESVSLEVVQERVGQLVRVLRQSLEAADPPSNQASLRQLADWYARQKREIDELPVDETFREDYLVQLNERYAQLCQKLLEEVSP